MKTFIILSILLVFLFLCSIADAAVWTVDTNPGNHAAHFSTLQAAHDGVADGDTLYLSGFNVSHGSATITKELYIFGPGYFLAQNDSTQANTYAASTGFVSFQVGSENSQISGCNINSVDVHTDSITIKRNYIAGNYSIELYNAVNNIHITQNYINAQYNAIRLTGNNNNVNISNNYIETYSTGHDCILATTTCTNLTIENNVLFGRLSLYNAVFSNNILRDGIYIGNSSNTLQNNICNATQFPAINNNQLNVDMNTVFVASGTTDGQWQIDPAGPAAGNGTNGMDIGMYGGITPYLLSGIPVIPTIYYFYGPSNASQSLQVQAKIKSRR